jgi:anti-anti-sigma factor
MLQIGNNDGFDSDKQRGPKCPVNGHNSTELLKKSNNSNDLTIKISQQFTSNYIVVFKLSGNMLQSTINSLKKTILIYSQNQRHIILELGEVEMISSAGWGFLIAENKRLSDEHRRLYLTNFQPDLFQVFESLQLQLMIQVYSELEDCITSIGIEQKVNQPSLVNYVSSSNSEHYSVSSNPQQSEQSNIICNAIAQNGPCSFFKLLSIVQSESYKQFKIGPIKLHSLLKNLNLDTFEKRERYFRSC